MRKGQLKNREPFGGTCANGHNAPKHANGRCATCAMISRARSLAKSATHTKMDLINEIKDMDYYGGLMAE